MAIPESDYPEAFKTAGAHLQACMDGSRRSGFRWLKSQPSRPGFCDLAIAIGQKIYAILLAPVTRQSKPNADAHATATFEIPAQERRLLVEESRRFGLVPVVFPLWMGIMQPLTKGWNLFTMPDLQPLNLDVQEEAEECPMAMSEWELCNFRVSCVMKDMVRNRLSIRAFQDHPDLLPHIWFVDEEGFRSWVAVLPPEENISSAQLQHLRQRHGTDARGYLAHVAVSQAHASAPHAPIPRGAELFVSYKGLERI